MRRRENDASAAERWSEAAAQHVAVTVRLDAVETATDADIRALGERLVALDKRMGHMTEIDESLSAAQSKRETMATRLDGLGGEVDAITRRTDAITRISRRLTDLTKRTAVLEAGAGQEAHAEEEEIEIDEVVASSHRGAASLHGSGHGSRASALDDAAAAELARIVQRVAERAARVAQGVPLRVSAAAEDGVSAALDRLCAELDAKEDEVRL